jgi:hypothetical protein
MEGGEERVVMWSADAPLPPALPEDDFNEPTSSEEQQSSANTAVTSPYELEAEQRYQELKDMSNGQDYSLLENMGILRVCGKDYEGRPIITLCAARLDLTQIDLQLLLLYVVHVMDPIVDEKYILVFLGTIATSANRPPIEWLSKTYSTFTRK